MNRWLSVAIVLVFGMAGIAHAQTDPLDRVETLVSEARYDEARAQLSELLEADGALAGPARARALLIRASLTPAPGIAEDDYLAVVLGYPSSPDATQALLRLGQSSLSRGDASRAAGYLQRLVRDYPGTPLRAEALLWLARAHDRLGDVRARCAALSSALQTARGDVVLTPLIRAADSQPPCSALPPTTPIGQTGAAVANMVTNQDAISPGQAAQFPFTVQAGAFGARPPAEILAGRLRLAGFEPRIVTVPANQLIRVRVGHHATSADAANTAAALRGAGFDALVVSDADTETAH